MPRDRVEIPLDLLLDVIAQLDRLGEPYFGVYELDDEEGLQVLGAELTRVGTFAKEDRAEATQLATFLNAAAQLGDFVTEERDARIPAKEDRDA